MGAETALDAHCSGSSSRTPAQGGEGGGGLPVTPRVLKTEQLRQLEEETGEAETGAFEEGLGVDELREVTEKYSEQKRWGGVHERGENVRKLERENSSGEETGGAVAGGEEGGGQDLGKGETARGDGGGGPEGDGGGGSEGDEAEGAPERRRRMIDVLESATGVDLDGDHLIAGVCNCVCVCVCVWCVCTRARTRGRMQPIPS